MEDDDYVYLFDHRRMDLFLDDGLIPISLKVFREKITSEKEKIRSEKRRSGGFSSLDTRTVVLTKDPSWKFCERHRQRYIADIPCLRRIKFFCCRCYLELGSPTFAAIDSKKGNVIEYLYS